MSRWTSVLAVAAILGLGACAGRQTADSGAAPDSAAAVASDPQAIAVADQVMEALGGRERWDALVGLKWTFQSASGDTLRPARIHYWDKRQGVHRVEGKNRNGEPFLMIHSMDGASSKAWVNGVAIEGDSLGKLTQRAKSLWTNDTYWMLMPYKLRDPGVRLKYDGEVREGGATYDKLALSFANVGETPGDRYWVYVNRANHRVERWEYVLEGQSPPPEVWTWEGWEQHAGLWFPTIHRNRARVIYTREVEAMSEMPASVFAGP